MQSAGRERNAKPSGDCDLPTPCDTMSGLWAQFQRVFSEHGTSAACREAGHISSTHRLKLHPAVEAQPFWKQADKHLQACITVWAANWAHQCGNVLMYFFDQKGSRRRWKWSLSVESALRADKMMQIRNSCRNHFGCGTKIWENKDLQNHLRIKNSKRQRW